ncbi:MAG: hypothetical protein KJO18_09470 [Acidimicrobiia bacterium]|nr:hypothetical protein [Acidimicrobiia bacterium]
MTCSRCGQEAAVKRDAAFYCGKCAMARDWEDVIAILQGDGPQTDLISFGADNDAPVAATPPPVAASPPPVADTPAPAPTPRPAQIPVPAELLAQETPPLVREEPVVVSTPSSGDLPADPFA